MSVVFQDYNVYPMSIKENVCLNIDVDDSEIILALQKSDLWDKVIQLPHGIDTLVSKEFSELRESEFIRRRGAKARMCKGLS